MAEIHGVDEGYTIRQAANMGATFHGTVGEWRAKGVPISLGGGGYTLDDVLDPLPTYLTSQGVWYTPVNAKSTGNPLGLDDRDGVWHGGLKWKITYGPRPLPQGQTNAPRQTDAPPPRQTDAPPPAPGREGNPPPAPGTYSNLPEGQPWDPNKAPEPGNAPPPRPAERPMPGQPGPYPAPPQQPWERSWGSPPPWRGRGQGRYRQWRPNTGYELCAYSRTFRRAVPYDIAMVTGLLIPEFDFVLLGDHPRDYQRGFRLSGPGGIAERMGRRLHPGQRPDGFGVPVWIAVMTTSGPRLLSRRSLDRAMPSWAWAY